MQTQAHPPSSSSDDPLLQETFNLISDSILAANAYIWGSREPTLKEKFDAGVRAQSMQVSAQEFAAAAHEYEGENKARLMQRLGLQFMSKKQEQPSSSMQPKEPLTNSLICPLITSSFSCPMFLDMVCSLLSECRLTYFILSERAFLVLFYLRNFFYLIGGVQGYL
ncbi:MAG: hypothetical protein HFE86_08580 [Clostridiales bacterium]|nr:hypothetical protein [Clostridiales bacterium]